MVNLIAIQSDKGFYIGLGSKPSGWYNHEYLQNKLFDGVKPEPTFHREWYFIPQKPQKISHMAHQENINYRFILTDDSLAGKLKPELSREEAGSFVKDCNNVDRFVWKDELAMYRSLYVEVSDPQPDKEVAEEFDFTVIFKIPEVAAPTEMKYPVNERWANYGEKKVTDYVTNAQVSHQILDQIVFPSLLLPQTPSRLTSKESYQIIREHVKRNIDLKVARITSDFDFCFAVAKVVGITKPFTQTYTPVSFGRKRRHPVTETRLVSTREVQVFEMTHDEQNHRGYTAIQGFEADNETELKEQIDTYLSDLMARINEPLVDCPTCNGRGVILQGVKDHATTDARS